jgi:DNA-directed RNA polymerase specialized sigma24 family protein
MTVPPQEWATSTLPYANIRREKRQQEESMPYEEEHVPEDIPDEGGFTDEPVSDALAALVAGLPPMERACVAVEGRS